MTHPSRKYRPKWGSVYVWHRLAGVSAALFVILVAGTGWMLTHSDSLGLARRHVSSGWLLDWYGIRAPEPTSFAVGGHHLSQLGEHLYWDRQAPVQTSGRLVGVQQVGEIAVAALSDELILLDTRGEVIERVGTADGAPVDIQAIGRTADGAPALKAAGGLYLGDADLLQWRLRGGGSAVWSQPEAVGPELRDALMVAYRGQGLSVERVVLDLHSGRILGPAGTLLVDLLGLVLLFLAATGTWMWTHQRRSRRAHRLRQSPRRRPARPAAATVQHSHLP